MSKKGFFASLFDISFSSLVTTKVIKFIYVLTIIMVALYALLLVVVGFRLSTVAGVLFLVIVAPLFFLVATIYSRVTLEFIVALFRVMETNVELVSLKRQEMGLTSGSDTQGHTLHQPTYQVGDVVNGHRWNGTSWVPVDES